MSLMLLAKSAEDALGAFAAASQAAFGVSDRMAAARPVMASAAARASEAVDSTKIDRQVAAAYLAAFTRTDQSVGMSRADMAASEIYLKIFSSTPNLSLPGYGFQTAREAQFWRDLFTVAPFLGRRA